MFSSSRPQAIVFDAYGTLFNPSGMQQRLETHLGRQAETVGLTWRRKQLEYTWLRELMGSYLPFSSITADALRFALQEAGCEARADMVDDLMAHYPYLPAFPDATQALPLLAQRFRLAILSNADPYLLEAAVDHNHLRPHLEAVLSVDAIRRFKPHPAVYEMAARQIGLPAPEILFVSSNTWDVAGAKSVGLRAAWIRRQAKTMDHLGQLPDRQLASLNELRQALRVPAVF